MNIPIPITPDITIEELVEILPEAISYLSKKEIRCIRCGEPIWGTLDEAARQKGFGDEGDQAVCFGFE